MNAVEMFDAQVEIMRRARDKASPKPKFGPLVLMAEASDTLPDLYVYPCQDDAKNDARIAAVTMTTLLSSGAWSVGYIALDCLLTWQSGTTVRTMAGWTADDERKHRGAWRAMYMSRHSADGMPSLCAVLPYVPRKRGMTWGESLVQPGTQVDDLIEQFVQWHGDMIRLHAEHMRASGTSRDRMFDSARRAMERHGHTVGVLEAGRMQDQ